MSPKRTQNAINRDVVQRQPDRDMEMGTEMAAFRVARPVNLSLLTQEVNALHTRWRKPAGLMADGNPAEASAEDPITIWVDRPDADFEAIEGAISAHDHLASPDDPMAAVKEKLANDESLTEDETRAALKHALGV